ncbi:unnamed protein product [Blepharisma stoltei]|uniref:IFT81 calponin homology domain-containing protein n=1 Tax=Blepharisma stoltei TaxID=1481888 RepID=A0AAU9K5W0_9CILI|nr:unnamed protein product [Blepharisma stoltei]
MDPRDFEKGSRLLPNLGTSTNEIKEIVQGLNGPPFSYNLTLVSFDEKSPQELQELLIDIITKLNPKQKIDLSTDQSEIAQTVVEFLKVLGYTSNFDMEFQRGLLYGDKRILYPIFHYIISNLPLMQARAYLGKFLVTIHVPDEFLVEEDMKELYQTYKELMAQFQVTHQELEQVRQQALPPQELKRDIDQLELEKEQLVTKISKLKARYQGNEEFQQLLEATSKLRKEQEEEAMLVEKLQEQQQHLEWCEGNLMSAQQRLIDIKKVTASDTSAADMLNLLRVDVKRNREFCNERIGRELTEKIKRLEQVEQLLNEPIVSQKDLDGLQNDVRNLQREVQLLEEKANNAQNPAEDKLGVYKQQASLVSKKKEKAIEKLKSLEQEESKLEKKMMQKEKEYENVKGGNKFMSRDEFTKYSQSLRAKKTQYQQMKAQLRDIRADLAVLGRTEKILKGEAEEQIREMRNLEREHGIEGGFQYQEELEKISAAKQEIDIQKGATLDEIAKIVEELDYKIKENRARLSPLVTELRTARARFQELNAEYESKKAQYDTVNASVESDRAKIDEEVKQLLEETNAMESKYHLINGRIQLADAQLKRLLNEQACRNGERKLSSEYNSLQECYNIKQEQQTKLISDLRNKQKMIKETHDTNSRQVKLFSDLRRFLDLKIRVTEEENRGQGRALRGRDLGGEIGVGGVNRLVLND